MAIPTFALEILAPHMKGARMLSLGYPDILATEEEVERLFGVRLTGSIDGELQHGVKHKLVETKELCRLVGAKLDCVDVIKWRGFERIADLNEPQDFGEYDLVIDPGTTEHCFNIGQAIMNAARAVRIGGRIYHSPPLFMVNHGFYNICPTALQDFYEQNGWVIERFEVRVRGSDIPVPITSSMAWKRNVKVAPEAGMIFMARRLTVAAPKWPLQKKYIIIGEMQKKAAA
jgi:hypothetical protein